ncbi:hypothetical protein A3Q56_03930 [Intoshia linei]|uniref:protein-serine/threonine phosphatase n=1 Tax=Intoshia linei TaxID=1819745 RepID=A0A177B223_9BILA|nr:hypothetical protein A3Q56_03930 [Intoshia linei]
MSNSNNLNHKTEKNCCQIAINNTNRNGNGNGNGKEPVTEIDLTNNVDKLNIEFSDNVIQKSIELKNKANQYFKKESYLESVNLYSKAIEMYPNDAVYWANRSFANLKLEFFGQSLSDAVKAFQINPKYIKAIYRQACAYIGLSDLKKAVQLFKKVTAAYPNDSDAKNRYLSCKKLVQQQAFCKAMSSDIEVNRTNFKNIEVSASYDGPSFEDDNVTPEFALQLVDYLKNQKLLHKKYVYKIIELSTALFSKQKSLVDVDIPEKGIFNVCGDVHGQFYDLLNIFSQTGYPSNKNAFVIFLMFIYTLFNGDFVDRGSFSIECILILLTFKLCYPDHFFMARDKVFETDNLSRLSLEIGNHETINMNQVYGFDGEVRSKYSSEMIPLFTNLFNQLPLAHVIDKKIFVTHGGLVDRDITLNEIREIKRNCQPIDNTPMCQLLWSDPHELNGCLPSKRGIGVQFGPNITNNFINLNNLDYVIRSHEVKQRGFEEMHNGKCITVFSAPNYCDSMGNMGAYITLTKENTSPTFHVFEAVSHPSVKPMAYANNINQYIMSMFN